METAPVSIEVCKESLFVCLFMQILWQNIFNKLCLRIKNDLEHSLNFIDEIIFRTFFLQILKLKLRFAIKRRKNTDTKISLILKCMII